MPDQLRLRDQAVELKTCILYLGRISTVHCVWYLKRTTSSRCDKLHRAGRYDAGRGARAHSFVDADWRQAAAAVVRAAQRQVSKHRILNESVELCLSLSILTVCKEREREKSLQTKCTELDRRTDGRT
ncbi:hypothetical protein EVAR_35683_1 [Eumeta japonica]|uniref:Uncharacterized protein n=1 Tax=Eumeta variegata TaxID=151549 RepID=A0A4C1VF99_EUMVA|nr:hypothetical protein EVAR_35683_1 [Eumeta japonica]